MCGEKMSTSTPLSGSRGSPPRMWGKVFSAVSGEHALGITPAYAGKSFHGVRPRFPQRDHPRVCGEKTEYRTLVTAHQGSPPRMRGKDSRNFSSCVRPGITPAYAGKSNANDTAEGFTGDHPRVCGEKMVMNGFLMRRQGSPPRMRGKARLHLRQQRVTRITPAYAGKRPTVRCDVPSRGDHPRVCGEKKQRNRDAGLLAGSPPRMRGKVFGCVPFGSGSGITPAYAGKR